MSDPNGQAGRRTAPPAPLDDTDRLLINRLQHGIPVTGHPFAGIAAEAGITEDDVVRRLKALSETGVLTRFGPMYNVEHLGGEFCLVAAAVPAERFAEVNDLINSYPEVAHNYEREHRLNMWFVTATESVAQTAAVLADITRRTGLTLYPMPKLKEFFLDLRIDA